LRICGRSDETGCMVGDDENLWRKIVRLDRDVVGAVRLFVVNAYIELCYIPSTKWELGEA